MESKPYYVPSAQHVDHASNYDYHDIDETRVLPRVDDHSDDPSDMFYISEDVERRTIFSTIRNHPALWFWFLTVFILLYPLFIPISSSSFAEILFALPLMIAFALYVYSVYRLFRKKIMRF